jgi:hypothetical protein
MVSQTLSELFGDFFRKRLNVIRTVQSVGSPLVVLPRFLTLFPHLVLVKVLRTIPFVDTLVGFSVDILVGEVGWFVEVFKRSLRKEKTPPN